MAYKVPPAMARLIDGNLDNPVDGDQPVFVSSSGLWEKSSSSSSVGVVSLQKPGGYVDGAVIEQIDTVVGNCQAVPRFAVIQSSFSTGSIPASGYTELDFDPYTPLGVQSSGKFIILGAGAHESGTDNLFDLWELGWRSPSTAIQIGAVANLTGYLKGPSRNTSDITPSVAPVSGTAFRVRVRNNDTVSRDLEFRVAVL